MGAGHGETRTEGAASGREAGGSGDKGGVTETGRPWNLPFPAPAPSHRPPLPCPPSPPGPHAPLSAPDTHLHRCSHPNLPPAFRVTWGLRPGVPPPPGSGLTGGPPPSCGFSPLPSTRSPRCWAEASPTLLSSVKPVAPASTLTEGPGQLHVQAPPRPELGGLSSLNPGRGDSCAAP